MKKILAKFTLLITFFIIFALSYITELIGIVSHGTAFMNLLLFLVFCISIKISMGVLINDYQTSKMLIILIMLVILGIIFLTSWIATEISNVDFESAFELITFGCAVGSVIKTDINLTE